MLKQIFTRFWSSRRQETPSATVPYLELDGSGLKLYLKRDTQTLGRGSDCDLRIAGHLQGADTVSHHHARLDKRETRWVVMDGGTDDQPSTNGVYVNGKRTLENYLFADDEIAFGEMKFRFHLPSTALLSAQRDA